MSKQPVQYHLSLPNSLGDYMSAEGINTNTKRILVADDRYENRYFLESLLNGNGYQTVLTKTGKEALDKLQAEKFDLILSDILMPVMDGYVLCKTIKKDPVLSRIPFIFYTASYVEQRHVEYGLSIGADEYLCKPSEPEALMHLISKYL